MTTDTGNGITMAEVARHCRVSPATVSAALHGTGRVSAKRREEIRRKARELGYHPQLAARMLRAHRTGQIGLVLPGASEEGETPGRAGWPLLGSFSALCEKQEVPFHIEFYGKKHRASVLPRQLAGGLVDGCLLGGFIDGDLRAALAGQDNWPWVSIDEPARHCVLAAADQGVYQAVQYLAALGHRRIAYMTGPQHYAMHRLGHEGFRRAVGEFALAVRDGWVRIDEEVDAAVGMPRHVAWLGEVLSGSPRPTAIVCHGMGSASAVIYAATTRGLRLPEDLSLVALGMQADAVLRYPAVSCIELDHQEMAARGLRLLQALLADREPGNEPVWVAPRFTPLATTGPCKQE